MDLYAYKSYLRSLPESVRIELADIKRFIEKYLADLDFREGFDLANDSDRPAFCRRHGLLMDPDSVRPLWEGGLSGAASACAGYPALASWAEFSGKRLDLRNGLRDSFDVQGADERFLQWRRRCIARNELELPAHIFRNIVYPVLSFELSSGCSVGCAFCGVSAGKLRGTFAYTPANRALWRDMLATCRLYFGRDWGAYAFNYWATDPLDNPDYEKFMEDFFEVSGFYPQTTTALAAKDLKRTRNLLQRANECGYEPTRFSVISMGVLKQLHEAFSPRELLNAELVIQVPQSLIRKIRAGRLLEANRPEASTDRGGEAGTIACVAGVLVNLLEGSIRLVSPCLASTEAPLGYVAHASGQFKTASDFASEMERLMRGEMRPVPRDQDEVRL